MENVRSCTQKMFAVRLLGSSVPAALAVLTGVGALVPSAVRAAQTETEPIRASRDFADDTVVDVSSAHVTLSTPASVGSTTIHVAEGRTFVLRNTRHDDANGTADWSQGHVVDATSGERLTFTGGDLRIEMPLTGEAQDNGRERAFLRAGFVSTPSQTDFENASVVLDGRGVTWGLVLAGERTSANFSQGFTMTIDRSDVPDGQSVSGILTQVGGTVTSRGDVKISLTAGVADKWMAGLQLGHAGNFESEGDVTVLLEGGKSAVPLDLYGMWVTDGDYASLAKTMKVGKKLDVALHGASQDAVGPPIVCTRRRRWSRRSEARGGTPGDGFRIGEKCGRETPSWNCRTFKVPPTACGWTEMRGSASTMRFPSESVPMLGRLRDSPWGAPRRSRRIFSTCVWRAGRLPTEPIFPKTLRLRSWIWRSATASTVSYSTAWPKRRWSAMSPMRMRP